MSDEPNEILAEAKAVKDRERAAAEKDDKARNWPLGAFGMGVGIGSAAVAAAVLFANRSRSKK
ncbi:hypothetical protein [Sphingomonas lenta]|uniref:Uncharacterized protein n=1 Tax=Sphingomonas lenta TaxID=1141887 RepID=A0A2A2SFZ5_9SPHN|nr:hypothetical protein [Sphingomonas lenta]PAX08224.1 hypothetical protein CKY28_11695 [Sphingomonas lenta]